jgi:type IV secretion system protein VirB9
MRSRRQRAVAAAARLRRRQQGLYRVPIGIGQGEMPPLFIIGPSGNSELLNYRARQNYYIVDRLFAAAELRLGDKDSEKRVRIVRTDGRPGHSARLF